MDFHITEKLTSLSAFGSILKIFENRCRLVWRSYSWLDMTTLYTSHVEFGTLRVFMRMYMMVTCVPTKRWTLTLPKFDEPFGVRFHFEKILWGNRHRLMWGSYFWLRTTWLYTQWLQMYQRKDGLSHYWKFDEPFGVRFHFENFWREPMSVNVRVVLLVGYDRTMHTRINEKVDSHITKIRRAFRRLVPFWKIFFGNRCRLMRGSYFWLGTTGLCTRQVRSY